jgi:hypothetical protein
MHRSSSLRFVHGFTLQGLPHSSLHGGVVKVERPANRQAEVTQRSSSLNIIRRPCRRGKRTRAKVGENRAAQLKTVMFDNV